jgi:type II secretory pathway component GspD/PulD (secretin)
MSRTTCLFALLAELGLSLVSAGQNTTTKTEKTTATSKVTEGKTAGKADDAAAVTKRFVYLVRHGEAKPLATVLGQHFKDVPALQIVPETTGNALLVTAPAFLADELIKTLDQLDRRPRQVLIDVLIAEVPLQEKENGFDPADFKGPGDTVLPKVEHLARKAKLNHLRRFQISTLENQPGKVQIGESKPFVAGVNNRGGGFGGGGGGGANTSVITYRDVGSTVSALPRVSPDGDITIELQVEESRANTPDDGVPLAQGVNATEFIKATFTGKVSVASGQCALADGVKTEAKNLKVQTVVVVSAKVVGK